MFALLSEHRLSSRGDSLVLQLTRLSDVAAKMIYYLDGGGRRKTGCYKDDLLHLNGSEESKT